MGDPWPKPPPPAAAFPDYEQDLVAWALANATLLREGRLSEIDADHLAEELEDLGKSERRALCSHIRVLVLHLLKWQFQPGLRGPSWRLSVENARREIQVILEDSPSLKTATEICLHREYPSARRNAVIETGLPDDRFPASPPYTVEQVLDEGFWT
jgi:hypothetical protein